MIAADAEADVDASRMRDALNWRFNWADGAASNAKNCLRSINFVDTRT